MVVGAEIPIGAECGFDPSQQLPMLLAVPRYILIDSNELRALAFKKHTAQFISAKLDVEPNAEILSDKHETVFVGSDYFEAHRDQFMKYRKEIVVIEDGRDYIDWLRCAYYGDENGCRRFNVKPKNVVKRNFWQRLAYLFKGE